MSASFRASSAPSVSRPEMVQDGREIPIPVPMESRKTPPPPVKHQMIPEELLVSLTSTVSNKSTLGQNAHNRHCESCGIRRPDAVWHHPLGRKKYKYFLEQPTSLTGAGRDISFLCDAMLTQKKTTPLPPLTEKNDISDAENLSISEKLIPDEYHIVKNKGIQSLEFYEDAFTVQLKDDEQKLRVLPSLRPSGRMEVVQLMRMMDDMLEKAGVDQQKEELTDLSQLEGLLELVKVEQNIYNIVFHELIRQVSVGCAERGELLAKLRQRYQSLLDRIPRRLKALHTETVAQRALDRRLTEEIHRIKSSIQQLSTELSKIRNHDAFVSQQAECAHRQLTEALKQTHTNSDVVQGYHELYELQRTRLEAQILQMTEDRDCWSQLTFRLALKVISVKNLQLVRQLHISEQSWFKTAEHCLLFLTTKDTEDLNVIMDLSDYWKEEFSTFMSQLRETEHAQCKQISAIKHGISKWLLFCAAQEKCPDPKYDTATAQEIHADLRQWTKVLALLCENYQGEKQLCCQQTLEKLGNIQQRWLDMSLQLFRRHPSPTDEPPGGQRALRELEKILSELLVQLDTRVSGESGIHRQMVSLLGLMESWLSKIGATITQPEITPDTDWLKLEKALLDSQSLAEDILEHVSIAHPEKKNDKSKPDIYTEIENVFDKLKDCVTSLSKFTEGENQRLCQEARSVHMAQTRWMLDLLLLMLPDNGKDQNHKMEHRFITEISLQTLDEDANVLAEKLDCFSSYITRSCSLILEKQIPVNPQGAEGENEMNECRKLQSECVEWVETSLILLTKVPGSAAEMPVQQLTSGSDVPDSPADTMETPVTDNTVAGPTTDDAKQVKEIIDEVKQESGESTAESDETQQEGEPAVCESPVLQLINYDGHITQRKLGESIVHVSGTDELVVSPATEESQKAFNDLTTIGLLQQELHDSEVRVTIAEQRALKAEEDLQAALEKIRELERQLQGPSSLEPKSDEELEKTPTLSPPPMTQTAAPKKNTAQTKPTSRKTKKR
ncbi:axonemal dynein light chain domain-containing protein 1 isoform X2 [Mugil cephalus]|uniref:axonemal dynein light chain domain-containing protein 1 isoform X2 n=1 Tax=Mugil cephalus TaxID=48193 RepID=UPI001FB76ADD|nr:axonemal dynein light chain domain-containing protein 1 isoform X2 [Mugil cephalus]